MVAVTRSVHGRGWNHTSSGVTDSVTRGAHIFFMLTIKTSLWRQVPLTAQISLWCNGYTLFKKYLPNHMNIHGQDDCGVLVPSSLEPRMFFLRRPEKKYPGIVSQRRLRGNLGFCPPAATSPAFLHRRHHHRQHASSIQQWQRGLSSSICPSKVARVSRGFSPKHVTTVARCASL
jgi:hypothetical protein